MARRSTSRSTRQERPPVGSGSGVRPHPPEQPGERLRDTLVVGVIRGAHGVRGEVRVAPDTDNPRRFRRGRRVLVGELGEREILAVRGTRADVILRLAGIADRASAVALRGKELRVPLEEARREALGYLWADLVGMRVEDERGTVLGTLAEVLRPGGEADVFVLRDEGGGELLLPAIESVIRSVDVAAGRMVVRPQEEA